MCNARPLHKNGLAPFSGGENTGASASHLSRCVLLLRFSPLWAAGRAMRAAVSAKPNKKYDAKKRGALPRFCMFSLLSPLSAVARASRCAAHLSRARAAGKASGAEGSALQTQRKFVFAKFSKVDRSGSMRRSRSPPLRSSSVSRSAETAEMFAYPGA